MKITRRQGLMAMVGGFFGGGEAAKSILDPTSLMSGVLEAKGGWDHKIGRDLEEGYISSFPSNEIEGYDKQIASLNKIISGALEDWQENAQKDYRDYRRRAEMFRIDNLKSIAPHYKLSMLDRLEKKIQREEWVNQAKKELKNVIGYKEDFLKNLASGMFNKNKANYP